MEWLQYRINDLRELLNLMEQVSQNLKDYGEEFIPELLEDLRATSKALENEFAKLGKSKELGYAENILKGLYPENI